MDSFPHGAKAVLLGRILADLENTYHKKYSCGISNVALKESVENIFTSNSPAELQSRVAAALSISFYCQDEEVNCFLIEIAKLAITL